MKKRFLSFLLVFLTAFGPFSLLSEAVNAADDDISIATAEDWLRFAEACRSDSYSRGRKFRLKADIDLSGTDYSPLPYFAGTLLGGGHPDWSLLPTDPARVFSGSSAKKALFPT